MNRCKRESLILSEDQAAIYLSNEEFCVAPDVNVRNATKIGDISLG